MKKWLLVIGVFIGSCFLTLMFMLPFFFFAGYDFLVNEYDSSTDLNETTDLVELCNKGRYENGCLSFKDKTVEGYVYKEYGEKIEILDVLDINSIESKFGETTLFEYALFKLEDPVDEYKVGVMELWKNEEGYYIREIVLLVDDVAPFDVFEDDYNSSIVTIYNVNHSEFMNYEISDRVTDSDIENGYKLQVEIVPNDELEEYINYISGENLNNFEDGNVGDYL